MFLILKISLIPILFIGQLLFLQKEFQNVLYLLKSAPLILDDFKIRAKQYQ